MNITEFKKLLVDYFVQDEGTEWVDLEVTPLKIVDIEIVSNKFENLTQSRKFVEEVFEQLGDEFSKGFFMHYTIEDAQILRIEKPKNREGIISTWTDLVINYNNPDREIICKQKRYTSRVISFYSYKGNIGKTLTLVRIAYLLAKKGRSVLMIDLNLEAPEFQSVFKEDTKKLKYGLVDYLYEKMMNPNENTYQICPEDIYTRIQIEEPLQGSVSLIPAGKLSPEYVHKLTQLQVGFISKHEYLDDLIVQIEKTLNTNIVLINSRAGISQWGAFSLLDMPDNIFLLSQLDEDSVEGFRLITEMVKKAGRDNLTVIFSCIDENDTDNAKRLFIDLGLEQEYISILQGHYTDARKHIVPEALSRYEGLISFILECELMDRNQIYLQANDVDSILLKLKNTEEFDRCKNSSNILQLEKDDIKAIVSRYVGSVYLTILENYNKQVKKQRAAYSEMVAEESVPYGGYNRDEVLAFFWGTRTKSGHYTKPMLDWFYEKLKSTGEINLHRIIQILNTAIDFELKREVKGRRDRLIGFESLERAFEGM